MKKLAIYNKNLSNIVSYLEYKRIANCIEFYYKNQKLEIAVERGVGLFVVGWIIPINKVANK